MPWTTKEGRTVDEARDAAVAASGRSPDELEIEVVSEGAKGLFGLGGEPAVVRVRPLEEATDVRAAFRDDISHPPEPSTSEAPARSAPEAQPPRRDRDDEIAEAPPEPVPPTEHQEGAARLGTEIVQGILERMGLDGDVTTRVAGGTVYIEVFGEEMGILIGRSGATLEALQEIVRAGIQRRLQTRQAVVVDVEAYWERRRKNRGRREGGSGRREGGGGRRGGGRRGPRREPDGNR